MPAASWPCAALAIAAVILSGCSDQPSLPQRTYPIAEHLRGGVPWDTAPAESPSPTRQDAVAQLIDEIRRQVHGPEAWTIRERDGRLIVRATPEQHDAIAALLARRLDRVSAMVQIESRIVLAPAEMPIVQFEPGETDAQARTAFVKDEGAAALFGAIEAGDAVVLHTLPRLTVFDGNFATVTTGHSDDHLDATGPALSVQPTIGDDGRSLTLRIRPRVRLSEHQQWQAELSRVVPDGDWLCVEGGLLTGPALFAGEAPDRAPSAPRRAYLLIRAAIAREAEPL